MIRLVDGKWNGELLEAAKLGAKELKIICPFIKAGALRHVIPAKYATIRVITRFKLADFSQGVSDLAALTKLLDAGGRVRGIKNLHAKLYLFGLERVILTSANLTDAALQRNHEFGLVAEEQSIITASDQYFEKLWKRGGEDLTHQKIANWEQIISRSRASGGRYEAEMNLPDYGADAGLFETPSDQTPVAVADAKQAFVKFLGTAKDRLPLSTPVLDEVRRAGCHWAVAYPADKRPIGVSDDATIFVGRLTAEPNDIRIFGRAIAMRHVSGRDDATEEDIARRPWKSTWPRYIRVHHAEFVAGSMANGISLAELMGTLNADAFASTQRNAARATGNTDPRKAYMQHAAVKLSQEGRSWLNDQLELAFRKCGKVPEDTLTKFDWPALPVLNPSDAGA